VVEKLTILRTGTTNQHESTRKNTKPAFFLTSDPRAKIEKKATLSDSLLLLRRGEILILVPIAAVAIDVAAEPITLARQPAAFVIVYITVTIRAVPALIDAIPLALKPPVFLRRYPSSPAVPLRLTVLNINTVIRPSAVTALRARRYRKQPKTKNDGCGRQNRFLK
jgi:hypothetical protein